MDDKRFELWMKLGQFVIGTVVLGIATAAVNWQIQTRQVEIKELEQLGKFVEHALDENLTVRRRFADYFATVSQSDKFRERWTKYKEKIDAELLQVTNKARQIEKRQQEELAEKLALKKQLQDTQVQVRVLQASLNKLESLDETARNDITL